VINPYNQSVSLSYFRHI